MRSPCCRIIFTRSGRSPKATAISRHDGGTSRRRSPRGLPEDEGISPSRLRKGERGIWQRRYWEHTIRDDEDFARHVDYIHFNPVKHGHVEEAAQWPFSSFHRMVRQGIYPASWAGLPDEKESAFGERR
jgi:putative transposase